MVCSFVYYRILKKIKWFKKYKISIYLYSIFCVKKKKSDSCMGEGVVDVLV